MNSRLSSLASVFFGVSALSTSSAASGHAKAPRRDTSVACPHALLVQLVRLTGLLLLVLLVPRATLAAPSGANQGLPACTANLDMCTSSLVTAQACGDGIVDPGEECDQANLDERTCETEGFVVGTLKCGAGCILDTSDCSNTRYIDNSDGTVTDLKTRLMWEKKGYGECISSPDPLLPVACVRDSDCDNYGGVCECPYSTCLHSVVARYTWNDATVCGGVWDQATSSPTGTVFTEFLYRLNGGGSGATTAGYGPCSSLPVDPSIHWGGGFAGHCDWRLPTIAELESINDPTKGVCAGATEGMCLDGIFGPTQALSSYWSATSSAQRGTEAWSFAFFDVMPLDQCKSIALQARAVRNLP